MTISVRIGVSALSLVGLIWGTSTQLHAQSVAEERIAPIDWERANADAARSSDSTAALKAFREQNAQALDSIGLPVLMPSALSAEFTPRLRGQGNSYVVVYKLPSAKLSIFGTSVFLTRSDDQVFAQSGAGNAPKFERSDDGSDLSFFKYGASYVLRLSCLEQEDERCAKDSFLGGLVNSFVIVGGKK
jgi:hypothetical protein